MRVSALTIQKIYIFAFAWVRFVCLGLTRRSSPFLQTTTTYLLHLMSFVFKTLERTLWAAALWICTFKVLLHTAPEWNVSLSPSLSTQHTHAPLCTFGVWDFEVSWRGFQLELAPCWMSHSKRKTFQQNTKPQPFAPVLEIQSPIVVYEKSAR